ncbi:multiple sugar transport system substrate-binding protein [Plantibacter sp. VKM Ac-1784]|jgi:multiple sugar transport system substrate-binding protein|uniref:Multiple sugar transport system substrate-binding protein n=1 Tax=Plantibacter elymi (nom. nud.) TaxID=199708 RepID=A0ABY1RFI3_9MICO|nr:sugar ABC transporter substrate-binding protein [Plantibacter sp. VKM Ac-1784]SMQ72808.1 multiple sugar transport system substrate-binding protein [Plantibacter sp. VKM Ac-1784]
MRKSRATAAIGLSVVTGLALSACAGGASDGTVTLQMVESLTNPARTEVLKSLIADFEADNPKIKVELISPPTDQADQKITQMLQSGSGVDVLEVRDITVGPFSTNGWLDDMSGELEDWKGWDDLTDNATKYAKGEDGKVYYVPYGFYGLSLFYRTDLIKEAGFDGPPKSWDDLLEQASAIQDPSKNQFGYAFRGGTNANSNVVAAIEAYVADDLDTENAFKLTNGDTIFSAPEALDAVNTYFDLFKEASPPSSVAWGYPEMVEGFSNGSTAFLLQDPEVIATVEQSEAITAEQWSTAPLLTGPTGKAAQPMATAGWGTAASSEHKAEAAKLIEFLSEDKQATTFAQENSLVPIVKSAADSDFYKTGPWASYVTMNENPDTYLSVTQPRGSSWWTEWIQKSDSEIQQVLIGQLTPEKLLAGWDEYWTEKWKSE